MEEGIAFTQRSIFAFVDVEFAEGDEPFIPDDKANNAIAKCFVTALLSLIIIKSPPQGILVRGEKLCHPLLDDDLLPLTHDFMAAAAEVVESE